MQTADPSDSSLLFLKAPWANLRNTKDLMDIHESSAQQQDKQHVEVRTNVCGSHTLYDGIDDDSMQLVLRLQKLFIKACESHQE